MLKQYRIAGKVRHRDGSIGVVILADEVKVVDNPRIWVKWKDGDETVECLKEGYVTCEGELAVIDKGGAK